MLDWTTGRYTAPHAGGGPRWRAVIAGDWGPLWQYTDLLCDEPEGIYGDLLPVLRDNDLRIVNVECVLGDEGQPIPKAGPNLKGSPRAIEALKAVPFDVATLCNNHVFDFGPTGLMATIARLQMAGLRCVGAGMSQAEAETPLRMLVRDVDVAIVNCGEGEENRCKDGGPGVSGFDQERLAARVRDLRQTGHVVIVVCHAGREYTPLPPPYLQRWYRRLADAGAHLIVGGHPHVPQGVEVRNGCPICYSTGNFIFWIDRAPKCRQGYLVRAEFAGSTLAGVELVPYAAELTGLRRMTTEEQAALFAELDTVSGLLYDETNVQEHWNAYADHLGPGMLRGLRGLLEQMDEDAYAGGQKARNYFDTPAHRELVLTYLRRVMEGTVGMAPEWARELREQWQAP